ncbi:hypothetical protein BCR44DRAFT_33922 [Catenaria anguillulae PL171]|uniref:Uncharacterized protein n=1 Tax=Catenaria anguillulae PL171 TaxID=765915 RepID=A0A1Y2HN88_9FUNG|nr:hypothetical protein BCR44DRAFT_33922 [Catenaria anguillulae PL171]
MDTILVPLLIGLVAVELALYLIHRSRQRRLRAKDLAEAPDMDVWYLPAGWTSRAPPPVPPPALPGTDPHLASSNPTSVARPPPTRHISQNLRTRGYVVLGVVEKWRGVPHPDDDVLPRYAPLARGGEVSVVALDAPSDSIRPSSTSPTQSQSAVELEVEDTPVALPTVPILSSPTPPPPAAVVTPVHTRSESVVQMSEPRTSTAGVAAPSS